eukprot:m.305021 g.305021  ORF g.305021 m.305021 type:complete len:59 (+) comp16446_c4_seq3:752-928(+)
MFFNEPCETGFVSICPLLLWKRNNLGLLRRVEARHSTSVLHLYEAACTMIQERISSAC